MTDAEKKKVENRVLLLSAGVMVLLIAFLIFVGVTKRVDTILFPLGLAVGLLLYWVISDVLSVIWTKGFEGKTYDQKKAYYIFALLEAIGFAGLAYFIVEMNSMTGALIYIACMFTKKRFRDEYRGITTDSDDAQEPQEEQAEALEAQEAQPSQPEEDSERSAETEE